MPRHHRFPVQESAAGACSGNGILFDITDPRSSASMWSLTMALPIGTQRHLTTKARRSCLPTNGVVAAAQDAVHLILWIGAPMRLPSWTESSSTEATLKFQRSAQYELRSAQRLDRSCRVAIFLYKRGAGAASRLSTSRILPTPLRSPTLTVAPSTRKTCDWWFLVNLLV